MLDGREAVHGKNWHLRGEHCEHHEQQDEAPWPGKSSPRRPPKDEAANEAASPIEIIKDRGSARWIT
jgi:hypothetical protein